MKEYRNLFKEKSDETLALLYEQYCKWEEDVTLGDNELGKIRDEYVECLNGGNTLVILELDLLRTIASRWAKDREPKL